MATFRDWLVFEQIREDVYERSLRRLRLDEAFAKALEFCDMAVNGRWDLILESSLEDEDDDGPVELADPFDGSDDPSAEVKLPSSGLGTPRRKKKKKKRRTSGLLPHERRARDDGWRPPQDDDSRGDDEEFHQGLRVQKLPDSELDADPNPGAEIEWEPDSVAASETVKTAKEIRRLVYMSRWAAMLDRRDLVEELKKRYKGELLPLLNKTTSEGRSLLESATEDDDDDDDKWLRYDYKDKTPSQSAPATPKTDDDDDDDDLLSYDYKDEPPAQPTPVSPTAPQPSPQPAATATTRIGSDSSKTASAVHQVTRKRLMPILEKLGYIQDSHLRGHPDDNKLTNLIIEKTEIAINETDNDPPADVAAFGAAPAEVRAMESNPLARSQYLRGFMEKFYEIYRDQAERIEQGRLGGRYTDEEGRSRSGSEALDGEALLHKLEKIQTQITKRKILMDGKANPWEKELNAFKIEINDENSAKHYINSLGSNIEKTFRRDRGRQRNLGGQQTTSIDATVPGADGNATSMAGNVADLRGRTADDIVSDAETSMSYGEAIKTALEDLAKTNSSASVMACLFLGLHGENSSDCINPETLSNDEAVRKLIDAMGNVQQSDRKKQSKRFETIGQRNMTAGGKPILQAHWKFIKLIHEKKLIGKSTGKQAWNSPSSNLFHVPDPPTGDPPPDPWLPGREAKYTAGSTPYHDKWRNYTQTIIYDRLFEHVLPFLARRIEEIAAEKMTDQKPKGWVSSCSWSPIKFLKLAFSPSIKDGSIELSGENPITVKVKTALKSKQEMRTCTVTSSANGIELTMFKDGIEVANKAFTAPSYNHPCPECGGSSSTCDECEGCNGKSMKNAEVIKLERKIIDFILTPFGTRGANRKPKTP